MDKFGILSGILCFIYAITYDYHLAVILLLYFIATKTDVVILINKRFDYLIGIMTNGNE